MELVAPDPVIVASIRQRLLDCEAAESIRILWAIESGSRAWGFPSPDSDYDCRFIYVRRSTDYLTLFPKRDVIENALDPVFDINGWDLSKAIKLALKGNVVILEWLMSPMIYQGDTNFRDAFITLAGEVVDRHATARHYLHLAYNMRNRAETQDAEIPLKKVFYVLRPVMALRWLRLHPGRGIAPMDFRVLAAEGLLPIELSQEIAALLAKKAATREMGHGAVPECVTAFYREEIAIAEGRLVGTEMPLDSGRIELANRFFQAMLHRYAEATG